MTNAPLGVSAQGPQAAEGSYSNYANVQLEFGAVGDGVADDTTSIQTAVNSAGGGVFFPAGNYKVTSPIVLNGAGKVLVFDSASTMVRGHNGGPVFIVNGSGWKILNARIDGKKSTFTTRLGGVGIFIAGSDNEARGCLVFDCADHGISIDGSFDASAGTGNTVSGNEVRDVDGIGISQFYARKSLISGNRVYNAGNEGITVDCATERTRVIGNHVENCARIGAVGGIGADNAYHNVIANNVITGTQRGLPGICFQNNQGNSYHNTVSNNTIINNSGYGIWLRSKAITFPVVTGGMSYSNYNTVSGNCFQGNSLAPVRVDAGCTGNVLVGNSYNGGFPSIDGAAVATRVDSGLVVFCARNTVTRANVTGDGTGYQIIFDQVVSNVGNGYNPANGVFTAPVTGNYVFAACIRVVGGDVHDWIAAELTVGPRTFATAAGATDQANQGVQITAIAPMVAGQTAFLKVYVGGGTNIVDVEADPASTFFTGYCC